MTGCVSIGVREWWLGKVVCGWESGRWYVGNEVVRW